MTKTARHYGVKTGDVWLLGRHRLMCGDAQSRDDVARLFDGEKADIVVTSPPYADARDYTQKIPCWDTLLRKAFWNVPDKEKTQLLINLGIIHCKGEWIPYWWNWLQNMREVGWRHYSLYIWDKLKAVPGDFYGRLKPAHELVFHFNKVCVPANRTAKATKPGESYNHVNNIRRKNGKGSRGKKSARVSAEEKVNDSVIRIYPCLGNERSGHPAQYPQTFASFLVATWGNDNDTVYDPFCGSGTTMLAAEQNSRRGFGMELAPEYVEIALNRWAEAYPSLPSRLQTRA